jgi:hypothetical protein
MDPDVSGPDRLTGSSRSGNVLVVEFDGTGHRFYYVRLIIEEALRQGSQVTLLMSGSDEAREHLSEHLAPVLSRIDVREIGQPRWTDVERVATEIGAVLTVVPEADRTLPRIAARGRWRGPGRLHLFLLRAYPNRNQPVLRWVVATTVKVTAMAVLFLLPRITFYVLRSPLWDGRSVWLHLREPVGLEGSTDDIERLRDAWNLKEHTYWFGIVGAINTSKNVPLVCAALSDVAAEGARVGLLVAGQVAPALAQEIRRHVEEARRSGVEVVLEDRVLGRDEFDPAIGAVDAFVCAYDRDAPSATFCKALAAGTRVIAAGTSTLRHDCAQVPNNASWCPLDRGSLAACMLAATKLDRPDPVPLAGEQQFARGLLGH